VQRGALILIGGASMLFGGYFLSGLVIDLIPTINPANSSLITDTGYHMLSLSNQLSHISQFGIVILVVGVIIFFTDRRKTNDSKPKH
jgi:hypothetical protein